MSSLVSVGLLICGMVWFRSDEFSYMIWNLVLAWLPLIFVLWLLHITDNKRWSSWEGIIASVLWLGFLPNSFYILSDLIHIQEAAQGTVLFNSMMFISFALNGLLLGYISLYLFHMELRKRLPARTTRLIIAFVLFLCSFAIYLGRDLRWNTWDVFVNPAGILFDLSNRIISPFDYPRMFIVTGVFFVLLSTTYYVILNLARMLAQPTRR